MLCVFFSSHGKGAFDVLPVEVRVRVSEELTRLSQDPLWYRRAKKLGGSENRYRIRVGRWRILFTWNNGEIEVADIFLKKERGDYRRRR